MADLRAACASVDEIYASIRQSLGREVGSKLKLYAQAFQINCPNGSVTFDEFEQILGKVGLFLKRQDLTRLYRDLDPTGREAAQYSAFLNQLQGHLNDRRGRIIQQAFDSIRGQLEDNIPIKQIGERFDPQAHPAVILGWKTPQKCAEEFLSSIDNGGKVSWDDFARFYASISTGYDDDDLFVDLIERVWHIKEIPTDEQLSAAAQATKAAAIGRAQALMMQRILQKDWHGKWQWHTLAAHFKFWDLNNDGLVSYEGFQKGLSKAGLFMSQETQKQLFDIFDVGGGKFDYNAFSKEIYRLLKAASAASD